MKIERDKVYHFVVSMLIVLWMFVVTKQPILSAVVAFFLGAAKEIEDKIEGRTDCLQDMIANGFGIAAGLGVVWMMIEYNIISMIN